MSDKKHIDRLFQEGFKDFEATPNDIVWKNIESKLHEKKKKRRVIPIWWRYAGVAAILLLLLTVGNHFFNNTNNNTENQIVNTNNTSTNNTLKESDNTQDITSSGINTANNSGSLNTKLNNPINSKPSKQSSVAKIPASKNKEENSTKQNTSNTINFKEKIISTKHNHAVANYVSKKEKNNPTKFQNKLENATATIANTLKEKSKNTTTNNNTQIVTKEKAKTLLNNATENNSTVIATTTNNNETKTTTTDKNTDEKKLSIEDALNNAKNVIEENNNKPNNRWSVAPNAAPVYFNTLGEGSSIDPQFNGNSKSGEINMSYGISASYAVNNKLSIRSGINRVNLGYNTNNVVVFQSVGFSSKSSALQNVSSNTRNNSDAVSFISSETIDVSESLVSSNASINQALGYIEIPLEIQYSLSNKKFGVNLIGGFSSFFLSNNEIYSEQENGTRTFLGEANNINKTSYSANFGLGLNYKVSKKFDLNLEPIFKYQFNTFNNTSGNFSPFFIGVYTGFAIKF